MIRWFHLLHSFLLPLCLLGGAANAHAAGGGNKDWKGDNGNSNDNTKWLDGQKPGRSDVVKVTNGKMNLVVDEVWGALDFQGGTIDGAKKLELLNVATSSWTGGDFDTVTVTTSSGTSFTITSGSTKNLKNNAKFTNVAGSTLTWSGSDITTGNGAQLNNAGTFTLTGSGKLAHNSALGTTRSTFTNTGNFTKHTDAGTSEFETVFNNTGNVTVSTGTLKLSGGGSSSGNISIDSGATLQVATTDYTFSSAALNGAGTIDVAGGNATFNGTSGSASLKVTGGKAKVTGSHSTTGALTLAGGSLEGTTTTDTATAAGGFHWTAGDITAATIVSNGGGTIGAGGSKKLSGGAQLNLSGTTTWSGEDIATAGNSTRLKNTGTLVASADATIANADTAGGRATFRNEGTFRKTSATSGGATQIDVTFENASGAHVEIDSGTLKLLGGGSNAGNMTVAPGANVVLGGIDYSFTSGTLNGSGSIDLESATTTFGGSTTGSANLRVKGGTAKFTGTHHTTGSLSLESGRIEGNSTATVGTLDWSGGNITAATINATNGQIGGASSKKISDGATLNLAGTTNWTQGNIATAGSSTTIHNSGSFSVSGDGTLANDDTAANRATFKNEGRFTKATTGAIGGTTEVQTRFDNSSTGTVDVQGGKLKLTGGGASHGNVTVASGGTLELAGNDYAFNGGTLDGTGTIDLTSAVASFNGTTGTANLKVSGGSARLDGTHHTNGKLILGSGNVTGTGQATVGNLEWTGGTLDAKVSSAGGNLSGGPKTLSSAAELTLTGNTTWDGSTIAANGAGKIKNEAGKTFSATGDGAITNTGTATFTNAGTFEKTAGSTGGATEIRARFENTGNLKATSGTLKLAGGGASSGQVNVGASGKLQIADTNYAFENATFSGDGTLELAGATTKFKGSNGAMKLAVQGGNAEFDTSTLSASTLTLGLGTLTSTNGGGADVSALEWTGGTVNARVKSNGAALKGGTKTLSTDADLTLHGSTTWDGSSIAAHGNARIRNETGGTFLATADGTLSNSGAAVFTNNGTFTKSGGNGGATHVEARFDNNGIVNINTGKLHLAGGGKNGANGKIDVGLNAALEIAGDLELSSNSELTGNGLGRLLSGTLSAHGDVRIKNFSFEGGSLAGNHTFHGHVDWHGGNWNSVTTSATTVIAEGSVLNLRSVWHDFDNRSIVNYGTVNWHSGILHGGSDNTFTNHSVFNDLNGGLGFFSGSTSFINYGEYRKTRDGVTTFVAPFTNHGTLSITSGAMLFVGTFTNQGAITLTNGATATFAQPLTFGPTSPLSGVGTITAPSVVAAGNVAPGVSPGALHLTGDLTLLSTSALLIELGGPNQGTDYDYLSVGGVATLDGSLKVTFLNGYQWLLPENATFTILNANLGLTGAFANVANGARLSTLDGAATFQVNYGLGSAFAANSVVLSNFVVAVPEPSTYAMLAIGGVVILLSLRRRKK